MCLGGIDMSDMIRIQDLENNPTARVPICLCLDTSDSMLAVEGECIQTGETVFRDGKMWNIVTGGTTRLDELQKGIELFYKAIREDEIAVYSAEICIVAFNNKAKCILDFANIERQNHVPELEASGDTHMGEGVNLALDLLEKRKKEYQDAGVDYYQPWLVLMTDGEPNGNAAELEKAINRTVSMTNDKKLTIFPIGIGEDADMKVLNRFSPKRKALRLKEMKFGAFFEWLSQSVARTSQSMPGENVVLDVAGIGDWGTL